MSPLRSAVAALLGLALAGAIPCQAQVQVQERVYGIIGKTQDKNFVAVANGCDTAARASGERCVLIGALGSSHPRVQNRLITDAIASRRYRALAVSVTESRLVAATLQQSQVPVITFDSPMEPGGVTRPPLYIGIDNAELGRQLARMVTKRRPQGGAVCLFASANDVNIRQRLDGARQVLSGNAHHPAGRRLTGENGWREALFCPFDARDDHQRMLQGMSLALQTSKADAIISLGHWPLVDPAAYRKAMARYEQRLVGNETIIVVAAGHLSPDQTALLKDQLVHGAVGIDFTEMGRLCFQYMHALAGRRSVAAPGYLPTRSLEADALVLLRGP